MTRPALPVHALRDVDRSLLAQGIGGKAESLAILVREGLPVPRAWVVPATAHAELLRASGLLDAALRGAHTEVARALRDAPLPWVLPSLAPRLAVRSSAADEDREGSARAGRYRSVLEVPPEGLADALRTVWASWHEARASAGPRAPDAPQVPDPPAMAVLLVEMVDPRAAGVLFTVNPLTGSWAEMVVEACHGLGEGLVSGAVVPDRYLVRRPRGTLARRLPGPVLARALAWGGETIVPQERELARLPGGGTAWRPTEAPGARKLSRETLLALCRLGLQVERLRGGPQDIEWALDRQGALLLLQARPITARVGLPRGGSTVWTRRFIGERWPDGATPLGWSVLEPLLTRFVAYPATAARHLGGDAPFRLVRGHPYVNTTVFRHLAFKLPGAPPPRFMLDLLPPEEESAWVRRAAAPPDLRVYASILRETWDERRWERFRWNPLTNPSAWDAFLAGLPADLARLEAAPPEAALATALPILERYVGIHVTSLLFANLGWEVLGPRLGADAEALLQPPSGSVTARVNAELRALGALTDEDSAHEALAAFLGAHGHRSGASWELWSPRWAEDPAGVLRLARAMATNPAQERASFDAPEGDTVARRLAALPPGLRAATALTRTYLRLREEQRYHLDRVLWGLKRKLRALGARWLTDPEDTRLLRADELDLAVAGRLDAGALRAIVARRAAEASDPAPPDFLVGDEALPVPRTAGARLQGLGISPGLARGRVRIVRGPDEAGALLPGEVLVARATDPGWTPLFDRAAGLVLELGSQLSHGAIVARELRLPAVANLAGATSILRDGEEITLDGRAGVVWRHAPDGTAG